MQEQVILDSDVLYEDNHYIAVFKKAGVLVQGDQTGDRSLSDSLGIFLKRKYNKPGNVFVGVIHRIDRPVSGLVLFAKTSKGLSRMNEVFRTREVEKTYLAVVEGKVLKGGGKLTSYLSKNQKNNKSYSSPKEKEGYKKAILSFTVLQHLDHYSLLEVKPETGRHHQIRVQLADMGHVIKGDLKYGAQRSNEDGSISLHSYKLEFVHPIKKERLEIRCPKPDTDIWKHVEV